MRHVAPNCYSCSCYESFVYLCSFMFFLELLLQHMQFLLCSILCLCMILNVISSPHSLSLQSFFHHQWICLSSQLCSTCVLSTTFLLHSFHSVCCLQLLFKMLLAMMLLLSYLDNKNLMSSWVGNSIDTWSTTSPSVLWMVSSTLLSWKPLYLYYWEVDEHLWYLETWKHSWQVIC